MHYHFRMRVVIDTSVMYQALYSSRGASHAVLELVRSGELKLALSIPVFEEYRDVLSRQTSLDAFGLTADDVQSLLDFVALIGEKTDISYLLRPNLRDENDNMFVELAFASNARYLITKNIGDFTIRTELTLEGITIITPSDFMKLWRNHYEKE